MERSPICTSPRRRAEHSLAALCLGVASLLGTTGVQAMLVSRSKPPPDVFSICPGGAQWRARLHPRHILHKPSNQALRDELVRLQPTASEAAASAAAAAAASAAAAAMDAADGGVPDVAGAAGVSESSPAIERLRQIVEDHVPGPREIGSDGVSALWSLMQSSGDADLQWRIAERYLRGGADDPARIYVRQAAEMIDRLLLEQGRAQRYGTAYEQIGDGPIVRRPVENEPELDARRAEIGIMPAALELCARRELNSVDGWFPPF